MDRDDTLRVGYDPRALALAAVKQVLGKLEVVPALRREKERARTWAASTRSVDFLRRIGRMRLCSSVRAAEGLAFTVGKTILMSSCFPGLRPGCVFFELVKYSIGWTPAQAE